MKKIVRIAYFFEGCFQGVRVFEDNKSFESFDSGVVFGFGAYSGGSINAVELPIRERDIEEYGGLLGWVDFYEQYKNGKFDDQGDVP